MRILFQIETNQLIRKVNQFISFHMILNTARKSLK